MLWLSIFSYVAMVFTAGYNNQASSRFNSFLEVQRPAMEKMDTGTSIPYDHMPFSSILVLMFYLSRVTAPIFLGNT
jgi:hypothetical protein